MPGVTPEDSTRTFDATLADRPGLMELVMRLLGRVNGRDFAGHPAGMLLLRQVDRALDFRDDAPDAVMAVSLTFERRDHPWNDLVLADGRRFTATDAAGNHPYDPADFGELDGHSGTLDLVERKPEPGGWDPEGPEPPPSRVED